MEKKTYTFTLTEKEANILMAGLQELQFKLSAGVINSLQTQAKAQDEKKTEEE